jgi:hypothetical protein
MILLQSLLPYALSKFLPMSTRGREILSRVCTGEGSGNGRPENYPNLKAHRCANHGGGKSGRDLVSHYDGGAIQIAMKEGVKLGTI